LSGRAVNVKSSAHQPRTLLQLIFISQTPPSISTPSRPCQEKSGLLNPTCQAVSITLQILRLLSEPRAWVRQLQPRGSTVPRKTKADQCNGGIGLEVKLKDRYDFIHLFSEVRFGQNLSSKPKNTAFANTSMSKQTQINVGVSFGAFR
jgi:hypothetical protein